MYEAFYGLDCQPFNITPDPRFLFYSTRHREAFEHLLYGITERKGFIQLTGEVGAGKTTICRRMLDELGEGYSTALVLNPKMTSLQLLRTIMRELGLPAKGTDRVRHQEKLNAYLLAELEAQRDVVVIIDEAQDLSPDNLEQVRLLSNLETDQRKLLQIVLVGQPELRNMLNRHDLRQLKQRITVRFHLGPLDRRETEHYIRHRLTIAGASGNPGFTGPAMWLLHRASRGVPRMINAIADKALLVGFVEGRDSLGFWQIRRALKELAG